MASILRVNTLTDASSNNSVPMATVASGSAKAWSTTSANGETINNSFNIATLTDVGTGQQQHNVTNNFANTNHVPTFSVANSSTRSILSLFK